MVLDGDVYPFVIPHKIKKRHDFFVPLIAYARVIVLISYYTIVIVLILTAILGLSL